MQASSRTARPVNHFVVYYSIRNRPRFINRNVRARLRLRRTASPSVPLVRMAQ
jgi:hypothetical protein